VSGSRGKQPVPVPIEAPDPQLNSASDEDWEGNGDDSESAGDGTTDDDADAEAEAEANAKRSRTLKAKLGEKGKKGEPMFTRKQFEALLEKERAKNNLKLPATYPNPAHPPTPYRRARCSGARTPLDRRARSRGTIRP
jgi:hypothetical protein